MIGLITSGVASWWLVIEAEQTDRVRFGAAMTNLIEQLDTRTERYAEQLERLADSLAHQDELSQTTWDELIARLEPRSNFPAFLELGYAANAILQTREEVEMLQRSQTNLPSRGTPRLDVTHLWRKAATGRNGKEVRLWLNERSSKNIWWTTINGRLRASNRHVYSRKDGTSEAAVSLLVPVFAPDFLELNEFNPDDAPRLRKHRFKGLLVGTIGWKTLVGSAFQSNEQIGFEAFADTDTPAQLAADRFMGHIAYEESQVLKPDFRPRLQQAITWPFYRARWQLVFYSTKMFDQQSTQYRAWITLSAGAGISTLMALLLGVQVRARRRQEVISSQLRAALSELEQARKEREQLSYDLHDGAIQSLYAFQLSLSRAAEQAHTAIPALGMKLSELRRNITAVIGELRTFILRHEAVAQPAGDLVSVINAIVERLRQSTATSLTTHLSAEASARLSGEQAVHLANLTREALSNALRHAEARQVTVRLEGFADKIRLEIADDGAGFDPASPIHSGVGLASMAARARDAGGAFRIESQLGQGTRVIVDLGQASAQTAWKKESYV